MKVQKVVFGVLLSMFSGVASAVDYYWFSPGIIDVHPGRIIGATPWPVCSELKDYVRQYWQKTTTRPITTSSRLESLRETHAYCIVTTYGLGGDPRVSPYSVMREGNGCSEGVYNIREAKCTTAGLLGTPPPSCGAASGNQVNSLTGNPINFTSGNKIQQEVDYAGDGRTPAFVRTYNSLDGKWRHGYSYRLDIFDAQNATLYLANGREIPYSTSSLSAQTKSIDAGRLQKINGFWTYFDFDGQQYRFDAAGEFVGGVDANHNVYTIARTGDRVTVTNALGDSLSFVLNAQGDVERLYAPNYEVGYSYADNRLVSVSRLFGGSETTRQYHYEDARNPNLLTGITDERGVRYATWTYDAQGRAVSSEHYDGSEKVSIEYQSDERVSVINSLGKRTTYHLKNIQGMKRIVAIEGEPSANCPDSNATFTYDAKGLLTRKVDNKGNITNFTYDMYGRESTRVEAFGTPQERRTDTYWHSTFYLPTQITKPKGVVIKYQYDALGRKLSESVSGY